MFDDAIIVQSAISAFNNAALVAPAFLWSALLTLPLYFIVWKFGDKIADYLRWSRGNITMRAALWTVIITVGWVVLFGGNYGVLRDNTSTLPFMIAAIVFVISMFIGSHTKHDISLKGKNRYYVALVIAALALSDMHAWWGPFLQVGAALGGFFLGRSAKSEMRSVPGVLLITLATTTAMLMQPEFFRFGQLGNLTWLHLIAVMLVGTTAVATIAVRNIVPTNKIHQSAYIKLKWMARFVVMLGFAVFLMTESVPVFLGTLGAMFVLFAMSVWHSTKTAVALGDNLYAITIIFFGIIITMPVIFAIGIVYLSELPHCKLWSESKYLL